MKSLENIRTFVEGYIKSPYKENVFKLIRPSIRLRSRPLTKNDIGSTKLGGTPDLPKEIVWPKSNLDKKISYSFLGQINLEEIKELDKENLLPKKGMLYFFFNIDSGDDEKVIFVEYTEELIKAKIPDDIAVKKNKNLFDKFRDIFKESKILNECKVEPFIDFTLPLYDSFYFEKIFLESNTKIKPIDSFETEKYYELNEQDEDDKEMVPQHRILGYSDGIQHNYIEQDIHVFKDIKNVTIPEINKYLEWILLFQIDADKLLNFNWADEGRIYYFIHKEDLKNLNFNNVKVTAQTY